MRTSRTCLRWFALGALVASPLASAQGGLRFGDKSEAALYAPHWQARVELSSRASATSDESGRWQAGRLLGDYYWSGLRPARLGLSGGFRATSGVLVGERSLALGTPASILHLNAGSLPRHGGVAPRFGEIAPEAWSAVPYVGLGYSGVSLRGGWGFSADLGLAGASGGLRTRREGSSAQGVDELLRELRLTPVLQFGASYAF